MKKHTLNHQRGASTVGTVILLGLLGYGVYVGLQYIPEKIKDLSVDSVLDSIESIEQQSPSAGARNIEATIDRLLDNNNLEHLRSNFKVYQSGRDITVTAKREWKLNLIFAERVMKYEETRTLK